MSKETTIQKLTMARTITAGLRRNFKKGQVIKVDGVAYTREEIIAFFDEHAAAIKEKRARYASYLSSVAVERKLARRNLALWQSLYDLFRATLGRLALPQFGMKEHGKPGPKTTEAKLAGVQKRAKKRAAK